MLISGRAGSGTTAFAAQLARACNFSFLQLLSADELRGAVEHNRMARLERTLTLTLSLALALTFVWRSSS